jgi:hypothetical protein
MSTHDELPFASGQTSMVWPVEPPLSGIGLLHLRIHVGPHLCRCEHLPWLLHGTGDIPLGQVRLSRVRSILAGRVIDFTFSPAAESQG